MNTTDVALAFLKRERARSRSLMTKNGKIWSYDTMIAKTAPDGTIIIYDYTDSAGNFISPITTTHVTGIIGVIWKEAEDGRKVIISTNVPLKRSSNNDQYRSSRNMAQRSAR
jgi:hypothetical protein